MDECPTAAGKALQISTLYLDWDLSEQLCLTRRFQGLQGVWVSDLCPLFSWQYVGHNTQQDVRLLLTAIKVTPCDDWEDLLEPVYSFLASPAAAYWRDPSLRVTLAPLPCFINQIPTVWVRQDPMWLYNHCFPWEDISHIRRPSEWEGGNL